MQPLTDWSTYDAVIAALFGLLVACLLVHYWQRRFRPETLTPSAEGLSLDAPIWIVLVGALLPWLPWLRDLVVLVGCVLWLGFYAVRKVRARTRAAGEHAGHAISRWQVLADPSRLAPGGLRGARS